MSMELQEALLLAGSPSPRPPSPALPTPEGEAGGSGDSSSASSGGDADLVSAQLINNITMLDYRSLGKTSPLMHDPEELCKVEGLVEGRGSTGQLPHFVSWNWTLIRGVLFWGVLSALLACLAAVIAMVASLPRSCNPDMPWYQGNVFYEVFPASFQDSDGDGIGDLKGIASRADYIKNLNVKAVRLNSIFKTQHYPENYKTATSLVDIDQSLGTLKDFSLLIESLHQRNISLVLDLPIYPFTQKLDAVYSVNITEKDEDNSTARNHSPRLVRSTHVATSAESLITTAIRYWISNGVDGFYLKGAEHLVDDPHFSDSIKEWKKIVGGDRILMVSHEALMQAKPLAQNTMLYKVDLVDVQLNISETVQLKNDVDSILRGVLWSKPGFPWVHWSVGSAEMTRLADRMPRNETLAALLLNLMLPGTPNIFYGDEIGMESISEPEEDFHESTNIHNLAPMVWPEGDKQFTKPGVLAWATGNGGYAADDSARRLRCVTRLIQVRADASPVYLNAIWKDGFVLLNTKVRVSQDIVAVERLFPRKNSFVLAANMGERGETMDLSSWYYGGVVLMGTDEESIGQQAIFKAITLAPAQVTVIKLEK